METRRAVGLRRRSSGFTLVELMVAMAVFLVVAATAFSLVGDHVKLYNRQQSQSGVNISLKNSIGQIQMDMMNAGAGYYAGVSVPGAPLGVVLDNNAMLKNGAAVSGNAAKQFDALHILQFDSTPPARPSSAENGTGAVDLTAHTQMYLKPVKRGAETEATAASNAVGAYKRGTELLLFYGGLTMPKYMTVTLTANGTLATNSILVTFSRVTVSGGSFKNPAEKFGVTSNPTDDMDDDFGPDDWALLLTPPVTYWVDTSTPGNFKLVRDLKDGSDPAVIAEGVLGFKVGAMTWNGTTEDPNKIGYMFDAEHDYNFKYSLVRSVRVSLIVRGSGDAGTKLVNTFDGGNYRVESLSAVLSPRNLSMHDQVEE